MKNRYANWRARQKCWRCGKPTDPDYGACARCRPIIAKRSAARYAQAKRAHRCPTCQVAVPATQVYCRECLSDRRERAWEARQRGNA